MEPMKVQRNYKEKSFQFITGAIFIIICLMCLLPIFHVVSVSFSSKEAILSGRVGILPEGFNVEAYKQIFGDKGFLNTFSFSIILTLSSTAASMIVTILAAYPLSRSSLKGKRIIMFFLVITMYFDAGMIPNYLNIKNLQLLDRLAVLIIPGLMSVYNLIILKTFFTGIDQALYDAAYIDGCGEMKTLLRIVLPLSMPAVATLSLFYGVARWNSISDVLFYINNPKFYTVQFKLKQMLDSINVPANELDGLTMELVAENIKSAAIVFSIIPMAIAYPFVQKHFTSGIMVGSVKG